MKRRRIFTMVAIVCSLAAAYVSYTLLIKHVTGKSEASWFDMGCSDQAGPGGANCAAVLASPYSYFPPRTGDRKGGIPVAFLGLVYYTTLGIWFIGVGAPSRERRSWHFLPMLTVGFGLAGSAYFMLIMFGKLDQWCTWCLVTHGLNLLIAVCVILLWPRAVAVGLGDDSDGAGVSKPASVAVVHPSSRAVITVVVAILAAGFAELELLRFEMLRRAAVNLNSQVEQCIDYVEGLKSDGDLFVALWKTTDAVKIVHRADDPMRHGEGGDVAPLDVVVFSDFECPSCARFALFFEKNVVPLFGGHIRTTFKHFPLDRACNSRSARTLHPYACKAAMMAEAVRVVGGNEAFWKVHDYLYHNRKALASGAIGVKQVAKASGLEESALLSQMDSAKIAARIQEDIELAGAIGVHATPAVYVDDKKIDKLAKGKVAFWDKLADDYFGRVGIERPASTRPKKKGNQAHKKGAHQHKKGAHAKKKGATQGSQGRRVAP